MRQLIFIIATGTLLTTECLAQVSNVWVSDLGNGTYKNPIIFADYSDPDVCRAGDDYYMVASSFNTVPGLPVLHSKDLVNWRLIGHALQRLVPEDHFLRVQHGNGVWAPSIRYHNDEFWVYYPDPDFGIYLTKANHPEGPWTKPVLVEAGKGLIDPCPLWDDDGSVYLVHAYAGSRAEIKSILVVKPMNAEGTKTIGAGQIVYDGHSLDPTIEGPKFYKRNGFYYIFAPAGGVKTGWQTALRSKNIYGPYERKTVMDQGSTEINGPHQGAWIETHFKEDWFIHFQDKGAYGRIVHLQPMKWENDWPVIGADKDGDGEGEPVQSYRKPKADITLGKVTPPDSDEFNSFDLGKQWQWQANPNANWAFMDVSNGYLRLYSQLVDSSFNYWEIPSLLLQKLPAEEFQATTKVTFNPNPKILGEQAGLVLLGQEFGTISISYTPSGLELILEKGNDKNGPKVLDRVSLTSNTVYLRISMHEGGQYEFSYSHNGTKFKVLNHKFDAVPGRWIGAKMGLYCARRSVTNDAGYLDVDWFRVEPLK